MFEFKGPNITVRFPAKFFGARSLGSRPGGSQCSFPSRRKESKPPHLSLRNPCALRPSLCLDQLLRPTRSTRPSFLPSARARLSFPPRDSLCRYFEVHVPTWEEKGGPCPALRDNPNRMLFVLGAGSTETVETLLDSVFPACRCDVALPSAEFAACQ